MSRAGAPSRERLIGADAVRAVATIGVISIHAAFWGFGFNRLSRFSVPVFVLLSGALLQTGYADRPRGATFLRRRFLRSLLPWVVWSLVYFAAGLLLTGGIAHSAKSMQDWWTYGTGHLWFLLLIPQLYLVYVAWPRRRLALVAAAAVVLQAALGFERILAPVSLGSLAAQLTLWRGFLLFPFWIGYFALGIAMARWLQRPPASLRWIAGGAVAVVVTGAVYGGIDWVSAGTPGAGGITVTGAWGDWDQGTGAFLNPLLIPFVVGCVVLVACAATRWLGPDGRATSVVRMLSERSLAVYILHPLLLEEVTVRLIPGSVFGGPVGTIVTDTLVIGVTLVLAVVAAALLQRTPLAITLGLTQRPLRQAPEAPRSVPA